MNARDFRWRLELEPDCRSKQLDRLLVNLMICFPKCALLDLAELAKMSELLEEEAFVDATSYTDYLHRVYIKLLRLETRFPTTAGAAGKHGMQSQVGNQGQSQISLPSQYGTQQQLATYDQSFPDLSARAQDFANFPPALPSMTSLTQTSVPNIVGLFNMQSGIAQDFVGSSVSQDLSSNIFSNTQWQMPDQFQQFSFQEQQLLQHQLMNENRLQPAQMSNDVGQSTDTQYGLSQYLFEPQEKQMLQQQLMKDQNLLQPTQMSNDVGQSTDTQYGLSQYLFEPQEKQMLQQQLMKDQNLLQPTQMSNAVGQSTDTQYGLSQYLFEPQEKQMLQKQLMKDQNLLQPTQMSNAVGRSTNTQSEIAHAQDLFQQKQQQQQQQQQQLTNPQPFPSSMNSNAQTGENADDWKEEVDHKMKAMKQSFLPYLIQMHQKAFKEYQELECNVSVSNVPQSERQKLVDLLYLLEKHIKILNISKDKYTPNMKVLISDYEKKVIHVIKSNWSGEPVSAQQQIQQPGAHPLSTQPQQQTQQQQQKQQEEVDSQPHATHRIIDVPEDSD